MVKHQMLLTKVFKSNTLLGNQNADTVEVLIGDRANSGPVVVVLVAEGLRVRGA
jgi:hypothetical protein